MQIAISQLCQFFINSFKPMAIMATVCMALELIFPAARYSLASYARGVRNWFIHFAVTYLIWQAYTPIFSWIGIKPLVTIDFSKIFHTDSSALKPAIAVASGILVAIIGDFFYYWMHRAQHVVPILWRMHSTHHSIRELTAWNSNHHVSEPLISLFFISLPLTLVHFDSGIVPAVAAGLIAFLGFLSHSSTRLNLGPLRFIFGDGHFHRIHHSIERRHWNLNFGFFTTIWDTIFGTAHFPEKGYWPEVGLEDQPETKTVREYLFMPFARESKAGSDAKPSATHPA